MSINPTNQSLENRLVNRIAYLEGLVHKLTAVGQPGGADVLPATTGDVLTFNFTLTASQIATFTIDLLGFNLQVCEGLFEVYVDNNNNLSYIWPGGASVSAIKIIAGSSLQRVKSTTSGSVTYPQTVGCNFFVQNLDSVSHNFYVHARQLAPAGRNG